MLESLVVSLILTIIIEVPIAILLGIRGKNDILIAIMVNVLTNPVVVFTANCILMLNNVFIYNVVVAILEISAVVVEFLLYKKYLRRYKKSPFLLSLICNSISFGTGLLINLFI